MNILKLLPRGKLSLFLVVVLSLFSFYAHSDDGIIEIVFASGPDKTGTVRKVVDRFNAENEGEIHVTWKPLSHDNSVHHKQLLELLEANGSAPHVFAADVVWTAEFATNKWATDITNRFYREYERDNFLLPALNSASYRLRLWGVPWYTDAGMIFYRKDLLEQSGFDAPPDTWDDLIAVASKVKQDSGVSHGFLFQGSDYEGGAVNAAEFIWSSGGEIMQSQLLVTSALRGTIAEVYQVKIKSDEAAKGLDIARRLIREEISPINVTSYREKNSLDEFLSGNAVFLRSWPYVYGMLEESNLPRSSIGVSSLPAESSSKTSYSCLGGWNLMLNANLSDSEQSAAWEFIKYMTSEKHQRLHAKNAGLLPVLASLYEDKELTNLVPTIRLSRDIVSSKLRARPKTPFYQEFSSVLSSVFQSVLRGEITGQEAVVLLDEKLRLITTRNK